MWRLYHADLSYRMPKGACHRQLSYAPCPHIQICCRHRESTRQQVCFSGPCLIRASVSPVNDARCAVQESKEALNTPLVLLRCCSSLVTRLGVLHRRHLPREPQTHSSVALYRKSQPQLDMLDRGAATTHKDGQRRRTVRRKEEEKKQ